MHTDLIITLSARVIYCANDPSNDLNDLTEDFRSLIVIPNVNVVLSTRMVIHVLGTLQNKLTRTLLSSN